MVYMWKMGFHRAACKIFLAFSQWSRLEVSVPNLIGYRCPARVVVSGQELVRTWFRLNWDNLPNKLPNSNMAWKKRFKFAWHLDIPKVFLNPFPQKGQTTNFQQIYAATQKLSLFIVKKQIKNPYAPAGFHPNLFCCSLHELQPHRNRGEPPESCLRLSFQLTFTPEQTERIEAQKFFSRDGDRDSNICSLQVENIQIYRYGPAFPGPLLAMVMGHKHIYIYICTFMHIYASYIILVHQHFRRMESQNSCWYPAPQAQQTSKTFGFINGTNMLQTVWGCSQAMSPVSRDENWNADIIPKLVGKQVDEDYGFQPPTVAFLLDCVYRYRILNYSVCILISCVYIYIQ